MIDVNFSTVCLIYLGLMLGGIFVVGLYLYLKKRDLKKFESSTLHMCEYCQHAYIDDVDAVVTTCPRCDLINKPLV